MTVSKCSPHGWTLDTLEKYLSDQIEALKETVREQDERNKERFIAAKEQVSTALASADKALAKAELAAEKRFEGLNELRAMAADQAAHLMPRSEYAVQHKSLTDRLEVISTRFNQLESSLIGKNQGIMSIGSVVLGVVAALAAGGTIAAAVIMFARHI